MGETFRIGEVAAQTGCSVESIRHYEKLGLLPKAQRGEQGYRFYSRQMMERVSFIRHGRALGLGLEAIKTLLDLVECPEAECALADQVAERHLNEMKARIAALQALVDQLEGLSKHCQGGLVRDCQILQALK